MHGQGGTDQADAAFASAGQLESLDWDNFGSSFRGWAQRFLQIFAVKARPLILVLDDVQWISAEELGL